MFYDVHSHIDLINENELDEILNQAKSSKISAIISCSTSFSSNEKNILLSKKYPQIKPALGLYPLDLIELNEEELTRAFDFFRENKDIFAIGEVGLDFKYSKSILEQKKQIKYFEEFIDLSNELNIPIIIHSRYAQSQVMEILEKKNAKKVLLHSFVDSKKLMKRAVENNYFVSVGISVTYNKEVENNLIDFPLTNLLFETDSPIKFNNEKATPKSILTIAKKVAEIKKMDLESVENQQETNFSKLFLKKQ